MTLLDNFMKMQDAERRGILRTRQAAHLALRRMMFRRSWFGRLGLRLGFSGSIPTRKRPLTG
jgi:hypothetical protein